MRIDTELGWLWLRLRGDFPHFLLALGYLCLRYPLGRCTGSLVLSRLGLFHMFFHVLRKDAGGTSYRDYRVNLCPLLGHLENGVLDVRYVFVRLPPRLLVHDSLVRVEELCSAAIPLLPANPAATVLL